jgi:membrane fusion protein, multidrug efflux system
LPNSDNLLRPNQVAVLKIEDYVNPKALLIPESIIQTNAKGEKILYTLVAPADSKGITTVKKQIVETGLVSNSWVELKSGIVSNAAVIKDGVKNMRDGIKVQIVK